MVPGYPMPLHSLFPDFLDDHSYGRKEYMEICLAHFNDVSNFVFD